LIGNDENCIQGHFYDATVSKMAAYKIGKLLMVSDFNEKLISRGITAAILKKSTLKSTTSHGI
jgi:hypothetical protein